MAGAQALSPSASIGQAALPRSQRLHKVPMAPRRPAARAER